MLFFEQWKNPHIKEKSAVTGVIRINEHIKMDYYNQHFVKLECIWILHYSSLSSLKITQDFPQCLADFLSYYS